MRKASDPRWRSAWGHPVSGTRDNTAEYTSRSPKPASSAGLPQFKEILHRRSKKDSCDARMASLPGSHWPSKQETPRSPRM